MANTDRVFGFKLVSPLNPLYVQRCAVNAGFGTALAVGDAVRSTGTSDVDGYVEVEDLAAGEVNALGIIIGIEPNRSDLLKTYVPASTGGYVSVYIDPLAVYEVQEDSVVSTLAVANVSLLIDLVAAGVDTANGNSGMEIDSSSVTTSGQFLLKELVHRPDNAVGANAKWLVQFAEHQFSVGTVSV